MEPTSDSIKEVNGSVQSLGVCDATPREAINHVIISPNHTVKSILTNHGIKSIITTNPNYSINPITNKKIHKVQHLKLDSPFIIDNPQNRDLFIRKVVKTSVKRGRPRKDIELLTVAELQNTRTRYNSIYGEILKELLMNKRLFFSELHQQFIEPESSLFEHLKELRRLKWLIKDCKQYLVNPLVEYMMKLTKSYSILEYSNYKIDLFKLLNEPLKHIDNPTEFKVKYYPRDRQQTPRLDPLFCGILYIRAKMKDGLELQTVLPVNRHAQHALKGAKQEDIYHYCIPVNWELFDIAESSMYKGNRILIHFDNSIRISYRRKGFWFSLAKDIERNWNSKSDQYLEVNNPNDFEILFTLRFQYGVRRTELFEKLGLKPKSMNRKS